MSDLESAKLRDSMYADTLAARPDLLRSDPLPREDPYVTDGVPRAALQRLSRAEAAARPRTVATDVPQARNPKAPR